MSASNSENGDIRLRSKRNDYEEDDSPSTATNGVTTNNSNSRLRGSQPLGAQRIYTNGNNEKRRRPLNNQRGGQHQQQQLQQQQPQEDEKELASQQIQIQSKRFYIDVKENDRGRFIKLAEVGVGGRKSRILMTIAASHEFKSKLTQFIEHHDSLPQLPQTTAGVAVDGIPPTPSSTTSSLNQDNTAIPTTTTTTSPQEDGLLKSDTIVMDRKRYYLDLKENQRGRFLRISMVMNRGARAQIAIPAQGLTQFNTHLSQLLDLYGSNLSSMTNETIDNSTTATTNSTAIKPKRQTNDETGNSVDETNKHQFTLKADNKNFYFDIQSNDRGVFVRVTEVRSNKYRTSITIPHKSLNQFKEQLVQLMDKADLESIAFNNKIQLSKQQEDQMDQIQVPSTTTTQ